MKCRKCKRIECNLSRRNTIERMVGYLLPVRPFRCSVCHMRFWGLDQRMFIIGHVFFVGFILFLLMWSFIGLFISGREHLITRPEILTSDSVLEKVETGVMADVETDENADFSAMLQEWQVSQVIFDEVASSSSSSSSLEATPEHINDAVPLSKRNSDSEAISAVADQMLQKKPLPGFFRLERISLKSINGATLMLHTNRQVENHTFFRLEGPARLVVDLPGKWVFSDQVSSHFAVDADLVEKIRLGKNPENLRIVFDLGSARVKDPLFESKTAKLEITLVAE